MHLLTRSLHNDTADLLKPQAELIPVMVSEKDHFLLPLPITELLID